MGIVVVPSFGADPVTITGPTLDAKVDGLATEFNGNIDNDNIDSSAAIANSKLNLASISQNIAHSGTMTHTGTLTMTSKDISEAKGADVASATTTTIWVTDGNLIHITGTTTITGFGTAGQAGDERTLIFDGALTLTHNATTLKLPGGANITTAANDRAIVRADTTANAVVVSYVKADGTAIVATTPTAATALSGSVIQTLRTSSSAVATGTTVMPWDDTIPQNTEGDEWMTRAITPNHASNRLLITVVLNLSNNTTAANHLTAALFQDTTAGALAAASAYKGGNNDNIIQVIFVHEMAAGTTSSTTFKVRAGGNSASTTTFNGEAAGRMLGGVISSSITIQEIKA